MAHRSGCAIPKPAALAPSSLLPRPPPYPLSTKQQLPPAPRSPTDAGPARFVSWFVGFGPGSGAARLDLEGRRPAQPSGRAGGVGDRFFPQQSGLRRRLWF